MIDDVITLVISPMRYLQTRNRIEKKPHDDVDHDANQLYLSRDIPSVTFYFIPCQEVEKNGMG